MFLGLPDPHPDPLVRDMDPYQNFMDPQHCYKSEPRQISLILHWPLISLKKLCKNLYTFLDDKWLF
jgi:hypothetical protein